METKWHLRELGIQTHSFTFPLIRVQLSRRNPRKADLRSKPRLKKQKLPNEPILFYWISVIHQPLTSQNGIPTTKNEPILWADPPAPRPFLLPFQAIPACSSGGTFPNARERNVSKRTHVQSPYLPSGSPSTITPRSCPVVPDRGGERKHETRNSKAGVSGGSRSSRGESPQIAA